jgi:hypothetical protein
MQTRIVLVLVVAASAAPPAFAQQEADTADAHFKRGVTAVQAEDYEAALREFRQAYDLDPRQHKGLFNAASCLKALGRDAESIESYERYLEETGPDIAALKQIEVRETIRTMRDLLGTLELTTSPGDAQVLVDGVPVPPSRTKRLLLRPGPHLVVARAGDRQSEARIEVLAREVRTLHLSVPVTAAVAPDLARSEPEPSASPTAPVKAAAPGRSWYDTPPRPAEAPTPIHRRWWFWTVIGAAVAAGAVATGLAVGLRDEEPPEGDWRLELP